MDDDVFLFRNGWSVRPIIDADDLRREELLDNEDEALGALASGAEFWAVCDPADVSQATVMTWLDMSGGVVRVDDWWVDDRADTEFVQARMRDWFAELRARGITPEMLGPQWDELQPVRTQRELLHLYGIFCDEPAQFFGGFDDTRGLDLLVTSKPQIEWPQAIHACIVELRSPYWSFAQLSEEQFGRAVYVLAALSEDIDLEDVVARVRDEVSTSFEAQLEELVVCELLDADPPLALEDDHAQHPRYTELVEKLTAECIEDNYYGRAFAFAQYLKDLLAVAGRDLESLRELPTLADARERQRHIEAAVEWRPSTEPSSRITGVGG